MGAVLSAATGIVFGLSPAIYASRFDLHQALKESSRKASAGRTRLRLKSALVVGEIALAGVLGVGAGRLVNSCVRRARCRIPGRCRTFP